MPDFAACGNSACPRRATCARYRMVWGMWQTFASFAAEGCTHHIDADEPGMWPLVTLEEADARAARAARDRAPRR